MNKEEIKAELRRSACYDEEPWQLGGLACWAENYVWSSVDKGKYISHLSTDDQRTFFLLVAEAL
jgi:hypothetical protein